jgi:hypothetical protein
MGKMPAAGGRHVVNASGEQTGGVVLREDASGVAYLTLNRPDKRNALDIATF